MSANLGRGRLLGIALISVATLALAACSSSASSNPASSSSAPSSSSPSSSAPSGSAPSSSSGTASFAAAVAANTKFEQRPTSIGITTPVGKTIPKGKVIDFIQCGVPACVVEGDILQSATNLLGWTLTRINAGTSPQQIADAYQQAVTNKPDAVIGSGFARALFNPELTTLASMKIPVLEAFVGDSTGDGLTGVVGGPTNNAIQGKEVADYILANTTSQSATIGAVVPSGFPNMVQEDQAFAAEIQQQCSSCTVKLLTVPVTSIGTDLTTRISSFLTANPSIQWLWDGYDDMVTGLPTALKGASISNVKVATISMNGTVAADISQNQYVTSAIGTSFPEVYWREIDLLARYFTGQPYSVDLNDATLPFWTITSSDVPSNAASVTFANVVNYEQQFEQLWGLSS
jgi:ABC-type sugar transport system substrate-binding protein